MTQPAETPPEGAVGEAAPEPLHPLVKRIFFGFAFSALGSGLSMPFLYVYLSGVRDLPTTTVGFLFAWMGLLGFVLSPIGGTLIDTFGPRRVMLGGLVMEALAVAAIGQVDDVGSAFVVASFMTAGTVALWPASTAMLTRLVPEERREHVYGVQFMLLNAGLGVGGVISALVIDTDSVASFQRLYLLDAASYTVYIAVLLTIPAATGRLVPRSVELAAEAGPQPGWRVVLRDRTLLRIIALSILAITFGYAQFEAGFAAYAVDVAEIEPRLLGLAYAFNTGAIVLGQLVTLRLIKGRRRSRLLAFCAGIWAVSWVMIAFSDGAPAWLAVVLVVAGLGVFGLGETIWAPIAPALVNALAVEEMRGRYNALQGMTWTVATIIGPAFAGMMIGHGHAHLWISVLVVGMVVVGVLFLRLRTHLTDAQDGVSADGIGVTD